MTAERYGSSPFLEHLYRRACGIQTEFLALLLRSQRAPMLANSFTLLGFGPPFTSNPKRSPRAECFQTDVCARGRVQPTCGWFTRSFESVTFKTHAPLKFLHHVEDRVNLSRWAGLPCVLNKEEVLPVGAGVIVVAGCKKLLIE